MRFIFDLFPSQLVLRFSPASVLTIHCGQAKVFSLVFHLLTLLLLLPLHFRHPHFLHRPRNAACHFRQPAARSFPRRKTCAQSLGYAPLSEWGFFFGPFSAAGALKAASGCAEPSFRGGRCFARRMGGGVADFHEDFQCMQTAEPEPQLVESSQR